MSNDIFEISDNKLKNIALISQFTDISRELGNIINKILSASNYSFTGYDCTSRVDIRLNAMEILVHDRLFMENYVTYIVKCCDLYKYDKEDSDVALINKDIEDCDSISEINKKSRCKTYKTNIIIIEKIINIYGEFLIKMRELVVRFLNSSSIYCDTSSFIDIKKNFANYKTKYLIYNKSAKTYKFKTTDPKIDIYKQILKKSMKEFNDIYRRYFNVIKYLTYKFNDNSTNNGIADKIITEIINNFNVYNSGDNKFISNNLIEKSIRLYKNNIYLKKDLSLLEQKKLNINIDNVSWSFIILIIIFAIILIEPTLI